MNTSRPNRKRSAIGSARWKRSPAADQPLLCLLVWRSPSARCHPLARRIEERFSKQEILYLYLNQIYFGHGAYGIGEAAHAYFGKDVGELSVSEGAQLAGLPKAPSRYSPYANPDQAERRRRYVLGRMLTDERIDTQTYETAVADVPVLHDDTPPEAIEASAYFTEEVRRFLFDELGSEQTLRGGLVIETTVDATLQIAAQQAVRQGLIDLDRRQGYRGHVRRVPASAVPEEIERLALENQLAPPGAEDPPELAEALEIETEVEDGGALPVPGDVASSDDPVPREVPADRTLLGVVTAVDTEAQIAQVAFAPGVEGVVHLADVKWAHEVAPGSAPRPVESPRRACADRGRAASPGRARRRPWRGATCRWSTGP